MLLLGAGGSGGPRGYLLLERLRLLLRLLLWRLLLHLHLLLRILWCLRVLRWRAVGYPPCDRRLQVEGALRAHLVDGRKRGLDRGWIG